MRLVNRWFLLFSVLLISSVLASLYYIQTESFSELVTKIARNYLKETQFEAVEFDRIKLSAFPPSLIVKSVSASYYDDGRYVEVIFDNISLNFVPKEIFSKRMSLSNLKLSRGSIAIREKSQKAKTRKISVPLSTQFTLEKAINQIKEKIPVRFSSIGVYETDINYNDEYISYLDELVLYRGLSNFELALRSKEVKLLSYPQLVLRDIHVETVIDSLQVKIQKSKIEVNKQGISLSGKVFKPLQDKKRRFNLKVNGNIDLTVLNSFPNVKKIGEIQKGLLEISGEIQKKDELSGTFNIKGKDIVSDYAQAKKLNAKVVYKKNGIFINEAVITDGDGSIELERPFELYSFKSKYFVNDVIDAKAKQFPIRSALRYIRTIVDPLDALVSGEFSFSLFNANHFEFKLGSNARADQLQVSVGKANTVRTRIIGLEWLEIGGMLFVVKDGVFYMEGEASAAKSTFQVNGMASSKGLKFEIPQARVNISDLGKIAGMEVLGSGIFDVSIVGDPSSDVVLNINGEGEGLSFEGNILGDADVDMNYYFNESIFEIVTGSGVIDSYDYEFTGSAYVESGELDFNFFTDDIGFNSIQKLTKEMIFSEVPIELDFITGRASGKVNISGSVDSINVDGVISDGDLWIAGEYIQNVKSNFKKRGENVSFYKTKAGVGTGDLSISGDYVMGGALFDNFEISLNEVELSQLNIFSDPNLKFLAKMSGGLNLYIEDQKQMGRVSFDVHNILTESRSFKDSQFRAKIIENEVKIESSLLGMLSASGEFYLDDSRKSKIKVNTNTKKVEDLFSFFGVDPELVSLSGKLETNLDASFFVNKPSELTASLNLVDFHLKKEGFYLETLTKGEVLKIDDGKIKYADLRIRGNESAIDITGEGDLAEKYTFTNKGTLNVKLFELFRDYWILSEGHINWNMSLSKEQFSMESIHKAELWSNNWKVSFVDMPIKPKRINFKLLEEDSVVQISKMKIETQDGSIDIMGDIIWDKLYPTINLSAAFNNIHFFLARDSYLLIDGDLDLSGYDFPLLLQGSVKIKEGNIREGFISEVLNSEEVVVHPFAYLPEFSYDKQVKLIEMGVEVDSTQAINLKNSWMDLPFNINLRVEGSENKPVIDGKVESVPLVGSFSFKDNTYTVKNGFIEFSSSGNYKNPTLNLEAEAVISDYIVNARIIGPLDTYSVLLTSSPPLESSDIFSLITFGYLQSSSKKVSQKSKENLTSIGVGSLLLDQLKIKDLLKNNLGVVLSVRSKEFESNAGFLSSKSGGDSIVDGRTQTSTRVQLGKQISKKFGMSMERDLTTNYQGLNLNYLMNNDVLMRGFIEQQDNLEVIEGTNQNTAVGVDFNLNWTFK